MGNSDVSVKIKNYKCFRDELVGFDCIKPVNIIIGRNNSGKSSLLDLLRFVTDIKNSPSNVTIQFQDIITEKELQTVFRISISGGELDGRHWDYHGKYLNGIKMSYEITNGNIINHQWLNPELFDTNIHNSRYSYNVAKTRKEYLDMYVKKCGPRIPLYFNNKIVRKLSSERDIQKEAYDGFHVDKVIDLMENGKNATQIICAYINDSKLDRDVIQKELLEALNQIFSPDNYFKEIIVRHHSPENSWEIYLYEENKGLVPLSLSGSGLKTVILVLLNILVCPRLKIDKQIHPITNHLFVFEELENNLHPSLLRRLFRYIEDFAVQKRCNFFITTHSNVIIDIFSSSPNAQIIHVVHDGKQAYASTVKTFKQQNVILDDIGVKASDLLQANGIVWLEGPSDRIYFNKWVELFSNGELKEHRDYECAIYGGALLAHFDATVPEEECEAVNILKINRNAILIGDSDKNDPTTKLKPRLEKIKDSMEKIQAYVWVTDVKEIENYIPAEILQNIFGKTGLPEIGQYEYIYKENGSSGKQGYWQNNGFSGEYDKIDLAHKVVKLLGRPMLENRYDLKEQMTKICNIINKWNENRVNINV